MHFILSLSCNHSSINICRNCHNYPSNNFYVPQNFQIVFSLIQNQICHYLHHHTNTSSYTNNAANYYEADPTNPHALSGDR